MWLSRGLVDFLRELRLVFVFIGCTRLAGSDYPMDTKFLTLSKYGGEAAKGTRKCQRQFDRSP